MVSAAQDELRSYFGRASGLHLRPALACQAESRLASLLGRSDGESLAQFIAELDPAGDGPLAREIVDALTCRETWFFRDRAPFADFLHRQLPRMMERRLESRLLRIWSAGCASGQEAYSLAMCLDWARRRLGDWKIELVGTDLSASMIERARAGAFDHGEIQRGLPVQALLRFCEQAPAPAAYPWRMRRALRASLRFEAHNLLRDCAGLGRFDIIFCRNVLADMHIGAQRQVLANLAGQLADNGFLVLGRDETPWSHEAEFTAHTPGSGVFERRAYPLETAKGRRHLRLIVNR